MPNSTSRLALQEPVGADAVSEYRVAMTTNAGILDNAMLVTEGTLAARPLVGAVEKDHVYKATDTKQWFVSDGTNWNIAIIAGAWQSLSLATNITSGGYGASARQEGDLVRLKGTLTNGTGSTDTGTIATVPSGLRPSGTINLNAFILPGFSGAAQPLQITSAGAMSLASSFINGAVVSLDGLSYSMS